MRDARRTGRTSCPPGTQIALPQPPVLPRRPREASASFPRLTPPRSNSGIAVAFEGRFGSPPYNALVLARHCWPGVHSEAPRSTALWAPASAFHRLPAPASCARPVPATPKLRLRRPRRRLPGAHQRRRIADPVCDRHRRRGRLPGGDASSMVVGPAARGPRLERHAEATRPRTDPRARNASRVTEHDIAGPARECQWSH